MKVSTIASWAAVVLVTAAISWTTQAPASAQKTGVAGATRQAEFGTFPNRAFTRLKLDNLKWNATEGNKLGVQTAVLEGDPAKEVGMKPDEFMRHPSGGLHYDGARDEEVWVLISGYGPTRADVLDKGELFGRIPSAKSSK